jgi:muramidase (phage lysozyme)
LNDRLFSTAAGRYQILERTYDNYAFKLRLHNFTPLSQDSIAIQLITETGAMPKIINGKLDEAIKLCSHLWASLPGNDYGQRMESSVNLHKYYFDAGGILA